MTLKLLTHEDIPHLLKLAEMFHSESPYSDTEFVPDKVVALAEESIRNPKGYLCVLALEGEQIVGFLGGVITELPFSSEKIAAELAWYVLPEFRGGRYAKELHEAYEYWANLLKVSKIQMALLEGPYRKALTRLYRMRGYKETEHSFVKEI